MPQSCTEPRDTQSIYTPALKARVNHFLSPKPVCNWGEMACLKPIEATQRGGISAVPGRGWQGHTCRQGPVQADCWWLSAVCTRGYKREAHTGGLRAMTAQQLATCPDPHRSIYDDKSCRSLCENMHPYTYLPVTLLQYPSNKQARRLKGC